MEKSRRKSMTLPGQVAYPDPVLLEFMAEGNN